MFFLQKFFGWKKGTSVVEAFLCKSWLGKQFLWHDFWSLLKTFQLPNFHPSTRGIFCCSQKVNVFFWVLWPPFLAPKKGSAESSIFEEPHILPQKKNGSAQQKLPPPNHPPVQVCQRASRNLGQIFEKSLIFRPATCSKKGFVNKCLVNHKLKPSTNYWLILPAKSKGTNLISQRYFFQNGWRCFILSLEVLGQIKLPLSVFVW